MTDSSRAGLAGAAGSCSRPSRLPRQLHALPAAGNGPGNSDCLCPDHLPWMGPRRTRGSGGAARTVPSSSRPNPTPGERQSTRVWEVGQRPPLSTRHVRLSQGGDWVEQPQTRCCSVGPGNHAPTTPLPHLRPYLSSIPASPLCPACPAAAHPLLRAWGSGCRRLAVLGLFANMLLSPRLVPQNQGR